jgi:hypothetical protein
MHLTIDPFIAIIVMPIPTILAGLVIWKSIQFRRAAKWVEGRARITKSEVTAESHRFQGEATTVTNTALVKYEFKVGSTLFRGDRISIGARPAEAVGATMKRFPVGAEVPVFYDPREPGSCVLERDAPVNMGCLWSGAAIVLALGVVLTLVFSNGESIDDALANRFPRIQNPLVSMCAAAMGSFCLWFAWAQSRRARRIATWPVLPGRIVSSTTESFVVMPGNKARHVRMYKPLVEYAYDVGGKEYRGTTLGHGGDTATSSESSAVARAARYATGQTVDVRCDPDDPASAVLEIGGDRSLVLIVVALALFGVATYAALHA